MEIIFQSLSDTKTSLGPDEVKKAAFNLIMVIKFIWKFETIIIDTSRFKDLCMLIFCSL